MRQLTIGILAHVDAGKTTLSEAMLYTCGSIRTVGRVDNGDAFLDTYELEKTRGITIFSKQAMFQLEDINITLLDTPGHVDFSAEMERTLQVLDYAILVISAADGVQGHTQTLWRLLKRYEVPVFLFINKMDQPAADYDAVMEELKKRLDENCVSFAQDGQESFYDSIAMCDETVLEQFLETGTVEEDQIRRLISERKLYPCYFGSALKLTGIEEFLQGIYGYSLIPSHVQEFGAKVFKIARDDKGNRLTYMKITGGSLKVRNVVCDDEKITQIRLYSGEKYETKDEVQAGCVCAVTGLTKTYPGQGLGIEELSMEPLLEPVLAYRVLLPEDCDPSKVLIQLRQLEEEEPELHIVWNEELQEIQALIMGEVQIEILKSLIAERFGIDVRFGTGNIVYKETISNTVEGVGHFEPLRHYAEVHLLLEPGEPDSGLQFAANCSEDLLDRNWQRLIMTHLEEKEHRGVLTGSAITDMKITLVAGRAHQKHTEGGDFRQSTYRAVRQGLKQAESVLLEPYYEFRLEVPEWAVGRAMTDIDAMHGTFEPPISDGETAVITGSVPVVTIRDYQKEVLSYTKGLGRLFCTLKGYRPCHNPEEITEIIGYDSEQDPENPTGSVFCAHGAGFYVPWYQVKDYMHLESYLEQREEERVIMEPVIRQSVMDEWIGTDEVDKILAQTYFSNSKEKNTKRKKLSRSVRMDSVPKVRTNWKKPEQKKEYLLVDGYNIIFAWEDLNKLARENIDAARGALMDLLCNYQGICQCQLIVVFDAYRVKGHDTEILDYRNIHVVFTKEAETADQFIEKFAFDNKKKYDVTVATSDGLEQIIIRGQGCKLYSARELRQEMERISREVMQEYDQTNAMDKIGLLDSLSEEIKQQLKDVPET